MAALCCVFVMQPTNVYPFMDSIVTSFLYNPVVEAIAHVPMLQLIMCNSCQPSTVHSSQTYREQQRTAKNIASRCSNCEAQRPNRCLQWEGARQRRHVAPPAYFAKTCENAKWCWISTDDGYVPFQHFLFKDSKNACLDFQHFTIKCNGSHCQGQELRLLRRVSMFWCCWTKDAFRRTLFSEDFIPHISCYTGSLLSALEVYLIVHRLVGGSSKGHSCWSQWGLRLTW